MRHSSSGWPKPGRRHQPARFSQTRSCSLDLRRLFGSFLLLGRLRVGLGGLRRLLLLQGLGLRELGLFRFQRFLFRAHLLFQGRARGGVVL